MNPVPDDREELTVEANRVRSKLLRTVEALDRRRHDALDLRLQVRRHAAPLGIAGGVVALTIGTGVALVVHRIVTAQQRQRRERWQMLGRVWRHPERMARQSRSSFFGQLARSLAVGIVTAVILVPARRVLSQLVDAALAKNPLSLPPGTLP